MKEEKKINFNTIFDFSLKILFRNWKRFILPFISLTLTFLIVLVVILFTSSASLFLENKNKELVGGDFAIDTNYVLNENILKEIEDKIDFETYSLDYHFSGILSNKLGNEFSNVSLYVIDQNYPIYGNVLMSHGDFVYPKEDEIYLSEKVSQSLGVSVGDSVLYSNTLYKVSGIIKQEARALFSGFGFLPKVFLSEEGFLKSGIAKELLRIEYKYTFKAENISKEQKDFLVDLGERLGASIEITGVTNIGFLEGLSLVRQFLILVVLLCAVLSAVNIYASILYLINLMKKSFAVLLALGFKRKEVVLTLSFSLFYVLFFSGLIGSLIAVLIFNFLINFIFANFEISLPFIPLLLPILFSFGVTFFTALASFIPTAKILFSLTPKSLLSLAEQKNRNIFKEVFLITFLTLIPLVLIAVFLLENVFYGILSILSILFIYFIFSAFFYFITLFFYKKREKMNFLFQTLVAQKKNDGFFGVVSFASLYVALFSLSLIILLQATLVNFLDRDLGERLPSVYIIDIQKSQVEEIKKEFDNINIFPNVRARIISIDGKEIQSALASGDSSVDRELGREYNLTYRNSLLQSEEVVAGKWFGEKLGEVSVEKDFAKRAGIKIGSKIIFSVSGFEISSLVTSLREVDSRSGLPFFFFVFNTEDLEKFPSTFFAYAYQSEEEQKDLNFFLSSNFPNISTIDTRDVALFAEGLISVMLLLVFIVALPPLFLALFLIINLIFSVFASRQKQNAQLLALGAKKGFLKKLYLFETISTTLVSAFLGYFTSVLGIFILAKFYLKIKSYKIYDIELLIFLGSIIVFVFLIAFFLWRFNKKSIKELLSYEEN